MVQGIVKSRQIGYISRRFILNNLMLAWETCEWTQQTGKKCHFDQARLR